MIEASIWERLGNMRLLMESRVDKYLHNKEKSRAIDLAQPIQKNQLERYRQAGSSFGISVSDPVYKEDMFN